jgi:hypothetical protein
VAPSRFVRLTMIRVPPELFDRILDNAADTVVDLKNFGLVCTLFSYRALNPAKWAKVLCRTRSADETLLRLGAIYTKTKNNVSMHQEHKRGLLKRVAHVADSVCRSVEAMDFAMNYLSEFIVYPSMLENAWVPYLEHVATACFLANRFGRDTLGIGLLERLLGSLSSMDRASPLFHSRVKFLQSVIQANDFITRDPSIVKKSKGKQSPILDRVLKTLSSLNRQHVTGTGMFHHRF